MDDHFVIGMPNGYPNNQIFDRRLIDGRFLSV
jgi:hypothetical protein